MTFVVVSYLPIATPKSSGVATTTRRQAHEMAHFSTIADTRCRPWQATPEKGILERLEKRSILREHTKSATLNCCWGYLVPWGLDREYRQNSTRDRLHRDEEVVLLRRKGRCGLRPSWVMRYTWEVPPARSSLMTVHRDWHRCPEGSLQGRRIRSSSAGASVGDTLRIWCFTRTVCAVWAVQRPSATRLTNSAASIGPCMCHGLNRINAMHHT